MFKIMNEYINQNNKKDKTKINEINDIKRYFTSGSGISSASYSDELNEAIIYINNHKSSNRNSKYEDIIGIKQIKYFGRANDWKIIDDKIEATSKNKVMELAAKKEQDFKFHVFIKNKPSHFLYIGEYYINSKTWISELKNMQYQLLPFNKNTKRDEYITNLEENNKFENIVIDKEEKTIDFSNTSEITEILREIDYSISNNVNIKSVENFKTYQNAIEKIQKYNIIHEEQIREFSSSFENNEKYIVKEGKFSDLIIKDLDNKEINLYEFKTVHNKNILSQLTKSVGQLYFYEYLLKSEESMYDKNYKVNKRIIMIEVENNISNNNFKTVNNFIVNNSEMNIEWKQVY
ncbi:hypothetical protein CK556_01685 [Mesoplasma chauliocola]|uniref:Uncharacterized protein n=1 Tax=Mesoplasma chauliocola TaxID=216427 RepID=A0A249SN90_9MOLU|nr:hypothetical protein [Mesoplasma chauliocola]ASZ09067.1 hypothetical protein CK556_01685 [Mesoplasma chauliocola]